MEKLLTFQDLMSGTRVLWDEEKVKIGEMGHSMLYKDTPEVIRKMYWWFIPGISLEFKGWEETTVRNYLDEKQVLTEVSIRKELKETAYIRLSHDDSITIWVYLNNKDIWNELVEYFGTEENIWKNYIRWRH